jgi:hypothetical protein
MLPVFQINSTTTAQRDLSLHFAKPFWFVYLFISFYYACFTFSPSPYTWLLLVPVYHLFRGYVSIHSRKGDTTSILGDSYQIA